MEDHDVLTELHRESAVFSNLGQIDVKFNGETHTLQRNALLCAYADFALFLGLTYKLQGLDTDKSDKLIEQRVLKSVVNGTEGVCVCVGGEALQQHKQNNFMQTSQY